MASIFENKERRVIPNFRNLRKTIALRELDSSQSLLTTNVKGDIQEYIDAFSHTQSIPCASDLLSAALVNDAEKDSRILDAANFLLQQKDGVTFSQRKIAKLFLGISDSPILPNIDRLNEFLDSHSQTIIRNRISRLKKEAISFPRNPFVFTELARLYSIIAQNEKAYKFITVANSLAPLNRYILRSSARLFAHLGDLDQAHDTLRKAPNLKFDPWLLSAEIGLASLRGRNSVNIKHAITVLKSKSYSEHSLSELAASIATIELNSGAIKKSKQYFEQSILDPNDNALAQLEWANSKALKFEVDLSQFDVAYNSEALALEAYQRSDWNKAIEYAESWFIDMPFAKRAAAFGNHVANHFLEDHETAIKFALAGLIANPNDPLLINNIAYSYALIGQPLKAFEYLGKLNIQSIPEPQHRICLLATSGLAQYRSSNFESGQKTYFEAILQAREAKLEYYYWLAILNLCREECRIKSELGKKLLDTVKNIPETSLELSVQKKKFLDSFEPY